MFGGAPLPGALSVWRSNLAEKLPFKCSRKHGCWLYLFVLSAMHALVFVWPGQQACLLGLFLFLNVSLTCFSGGGGVN